MANNELSLSSLGIQLPYNMQAEQSVLGAALMDETILNRLITEMDPDMFYSEQNRAVYEEMRRLFSESEAVDVITLVDSLAQNGVFRAQMMPKCTLPALRKPSRRFPTSILTSRSSRKNIKPAV